MLELKKSSTERFCIIDENILTEKYGFGRHYKADTKEVIHNCILELMHTLAEKMMIDGILKSEPKVQFDVETTFGLEFSFNDDKKNYASKESKLHRFLKKSSCHKLLENHYNIEFEKTFVIHIQKYLVGLSDYHTTTQVILSVIKNNKDMIINQAISSLSKLFQKEVIESLDVNDIFDKVIEDIDTHIHMENSRLKSIFESIKDRYCIKPFFEKRLRCDVIGNNFENKNDIIMVECSNYDLCDKWNYYKMIKENFPKITIIQASSVPRTVPYFAKNWVFNYESTTTEEIQ